MNEYLPGQRWISVTESELGLGIITDSTQQRISVLYPACGEKRTYSRDNAPLTRVSYEIGDIINNNQKLSIEVEKVELRDGLYVYSGLDSQGRRLQFDELDLNHHSQFNKPEQRLFSGQMDPGKWFNLRYQTWRHQQRLQQSDVKGLVGPRTALIAHQLYIANQAGKRFAPRIMLADEVGLGKTIEAGLIIHQRLQQQLSQRVLIIVPEALLHQWLVEMIRRFNLHFSIFDEARCLDTQDSNPFVTEQLVLCSSGFFNQHSERQTQVLSANWDMLVVDEAHHLEWNKGQPGAEFQFVKQLADITPGLLLLTATPEQLGKDSHFAQLQLLDPERFYDFGSFELEQLEFEPIAKAARLLSQNKPLDADLIEQLRSKLKNDNVDTLLSNIGNAEASPDQVAQLLSILVDHHGTGRVLFRNSRQIVKGFPKRQVHGYPLAVTNEPGGKEQQVEQQFNWLLQLLTKLTENKALLICKRAETALFLQGQLKNKSVFRAAVFHEGMSIIERDKAAAYFADPESRAQLLICSEIGSEGRNFQFVHHLILFDLPDNPDLLQQRIGRLDRIGQQHEIEIHIPYLLHSYEHVLFKWYHEGLNSFVVNNDAAQQIYQIHQPELYQLQQQFNQQRLDELIVTTRRLSEALIKQLHEGKDILLELNSCNSETALQLIDQINDLEQNHALWPYMEKLLDCYGVASEEHSADTYILTPGNHMRVEHFPELPEQGVTVTVNRDTALVHEDWRFLSWEHPMVNAAMDLILSSEFGNASVSMIKHENYPAGKFFIQALFIIECSAPPELQINRFLPPTPIMIVVDQNGADQTETGFQELMKEIHKKLNFVQLSGFFNNQRELINHLLTEANNAALNRLPEILSESHESFQNRQNLEIQRLVHLKKLNTGVKQAEIEHLKHNAQQASELIAAAQLKLDAVRFLITA